MPTPRRSLTLTAPQRFECMVYGAPKPKGSWNVYPHPKTGMAQLVNDAKGGQAWGTEMTLRFKAVPLLQPMFGPVCVHVTFWLPKPRTVKRAWPSVKPDLDKLCRAVLDSLVSAWVLKDDGQVVKMDATKWYADDVQFQGVYVVVEALEEDSRKERFDEDCRPTDWL
jgi:Holliday junction resolvase RusA-like endonuclease